MEGLMMEYAIEVIQKKAMKAEEQRCLRRKQVLARLGMGLVLVLALLIGIHIRSFLTMRVFADEPVYSLSEAYDKMEMYGDKNNREAVLVRETGQNTHTPRPYYISIRVERGDSLWSIASRYAAKSPMDVQGYVEELKRINQLPGDTIHAGHYLMVVYYK